MAYAFTRGDSRKTTVTTAQKNKVREPRTSSHYLKPGSTMAGMPGFIGTGLGAGEGGSKGSKVSSVKGRAPGTPNIDVGKGPAHNAKKLQARAVGTAGRSGWYTRGSGKMEKLAGQAKAFGERKGGKSNMY